MDVVYEAGLVMRLSLIAGDASYRVAWMLYATKTEANHVEEPARKTTRALSRDVVSRGQ